ncbi:MAG: prepilin-type N-terminal cleavage/methylation domain-containing protein [Candidatus Babeliaceae bacterium]|jgi:prepilin-type N-terminal cleavage/methylation domain-containing protein
MKSKSPQPNGFSLVEVVIALTVFAMIMTSLLALQGTLTTTLARASRRISSCMHVKNFFYEIERKKKESDAKISSEEKKTEAGILTYSEEPLGKDSAFKKLKNLVINKVELRSTLGGRSQLVYIKHAGEKHE